MKKIILGILICLISIFTTGCIKVSYDIEIDNKGKISFSTTEGINTKVFKSFGMDFDKEHQESLDKNKKELEAKGFKVQEYNDGTFKGLTASKSGIDFLEVEELFGEGFSDESSFEIVKGFFKNTYKIHLSANRENIGDSVAKKGEDPNASEPDLLSSASTVDSATGEVIETKKYKDGSTTIKRTNEKTGEVIEKTEGGNGGVSHSSTARYNQNKFDELGFTFSDMLRDHPEMLPVIDFNIKLPVKASSHNADKVLENNRYQWNLVKENPVTEINIEFERYNFLNIILSIVLAIMALIFTKTQIANSYKPTDDDNYTDSAY